MTAMPQSAGASTAQVEQIIAAVNGLGRADLEHHGAWQQLADLSENTSFNGIDIDPQSIVVRADNSFEAIADVFVTMNYGGGAPASLGDGYPATIRGTISPHGAVVQQIDIETSSYY